MRRPARLLISLACAASFALAAPAAATSGAALPPVQPGSITLCEFERGEEMRWRLIDQVWRPVCEDPAAATPADQTAIAPQSTVTMPVTLTLPLTTILSLLVAVAASASLLARAGQDSPG